MKLDQRSPSTWVGIGAVLILVGLVVAGAAADSPGAGWVLVGAGALLAVVGLAMYVVRGRRRTDPRVGRPSGPQTG